MRILVLAAAASFGCHGAASHAADGSVGTSDGTTMADGAAAQVTLATPVKKQIFLEMVNSAEQSALDWTTAYPYCEDIGDGRGYTTGIAGFTTDSAGATTDDGPARRPTTGRVCSASSSITTPSRRGTCSRSTPRH
jgi:hypothetical protein